MIICVTGPEYVHMRLWRNVANVYAVIPYDHVAWKPFLHYKPFVKGIHFLLDCVELLNSSTDTRMIYSSKCIHYAGNCHTLLSGRLLVGRRHTPLRCWVRPGGSTTINSSVYAQYSLTHPALSTGLFMFLFRMILITRALIQHKDVVLPV